MFNQSFKVDKVSGKEIVITLAGNPNVGKSTVFNNLTGLKQHTGNWPGKTVIKAQGSHKYKDKEFIVVDLPGTYSLMANSEEEEIARDFICFGEPDVTVVITDATCLERNLNLVLQTLEITQKVVVCVNLMDEAKGKKINIDLEELSNQLGVPVVGTNARSKKGLKELMEVVYLVATGKIINNPIRLMYNKEIEEQIGKLQIMIKKEIGEKLNSRWVSLKLLEGNERLISTINELVGCNLPIGKYRSEDVLYGCVIPRIVLRAQEIKNLAVSYGNPEYNQRDRKIDKALTSKIFGIPIMLAILGVIFWITIVGANYPSDAITKFLFWIEGLLRIGFNYMKIPTWLTEMFILGVYRTLAWVVAVMLPPMAIFFPLFTFLEDLGYLPRVAFNLDYFFKKAGAHGKQALTMCMGFGCNCAGVIGCRIIDSPREKLIAIITNNFVPCNGRFPTLIAVSTIFIGGAVGGIYGSVLSSLAVIGIVVLGILITLFISYLLSKTILRGIPSSFILELPPYRRPQVGRIILRSIFDRTLFVLGRAIVVAAPAGLIIWGLANLELGGVSLLTYGASFLQPFAYAIGLDGYILMAFILGLPANEIVIPIIIMSYMSAGSLLELNSVYALGDLLIANGWTWVTALSVMIFTLVHYPCGTSLLTIYKESGSIKWTIISFLVPTILGLSLCFVVTQLIRIFML